jgi:hypothetical protein
MTEPRALMATGPRELRHPDAVRAGFASAVAGFTLAVTGGAEGADTQAAWGAADAGVPFEVWLPNRFYRQAYPRSIPDELLAQAARVRYVVDRQVSPGEDPMAMWHRMKWWVDNFARNVAMVEVADAAAVIAPEHPRERVRMRRSGTARCIEALIAAGYESCLWIHDDPAGTVEEVALVASSQPSLFTDPAVLSHRRR